MANAERREAIVLHRSQYRDSDLMVTALSEEGPLSFLARGARKPNSKNAASLTLSAVSSFSFLKGPKGGLTLKEGEAIALPRLDSDLLSAASYNLIAEVLRSFFAGSEAEAGKVYRFSRKVLLKMNEGFDSLSGAALVFAYALRESGYGLTVSQCVRTGSKRGIAGLSWDDGGFLSKEAAAFAERRDPYYLKLVRYAFLCPEDKAGEVSFKREEALTFLKEASSFALDKAGVRLSSMRLFDVL